jgi:hypothetical protein
VVFRGPFKDSILLQQGCKGSGKMGKVWDKGVLIAKNPKDLSDLLDAFQCSGPICKYFDFSRVNGDAILIQLHS